MTPLELRCIKALARGLIAAGNGPVMEQAASALTALLDELNAAGWQMAPKDASEAMVTAGVTDENEWRRMPMPEVRMKLNWTAMLAAAPKPFEGGE